MAVGMRSVKVIGQVCLIFSQRRPLAPNDSTNVRFETALREPWVEAHAGATRVLRFAHEGKVVTGAATIEVTPGTTGWIVHGSFHVRSVDPLDGSKFLPPDVVLWQ